MKTIIITSQALSLENEFKSKIYYEFVFKGKTFQAQEHMKEISITNTTEKPTLALLYNTICIMYLREQIVSMVNSLLS
jgi:hypothetical protein